MRTLLTAAPLLALSGVAFLLSGCANMKVTHVPPGESLNVALAKKPDLVRLPAPDPATMAVPAGYAAVEPELPGNSIMDRVAEAYTRGEFCLSAGKDDEAISAFEEVVKIDPTFTEGWQHLAMLYEKKGDSKKAMQAFRHAKKVALH